jgi:8-oxo-dGTP pyrophosphatase MutT (NUDIX family)
MDAGETPEEAALRELEEELGVSLPGESVIGRLDDFPTRSGFRITPVVIWGGCDLSLRPDPHEVEEVFRIPFIELDSPEIPQFYPAPGQEEPVFSAPLATLGHPVYAPTAAMLYQFREVVLRGTPTRVAHYEQPRFAWR